MTTSITETIQTAVLTPQTLKRQTINFPAKCQLAELESFLKRYFHGVSKRNGKLDLLLELDFAEVTIIEVASLVYLVSFIKKNATKKKVSIKLPTDVKILDFLVIWKFMEALESIGFNPSDLLNDEEMARYYSRKGSPDLHYSDNEILEPQEVRVLAENFFSLKVFRLSDFNKTRFIFDRSNHWGQQSILAVLKKYLDTEDPYAYSGLPSRVILEAIANSAEHPNAEFVLIASKIEILDNKHFFSLVIWDDGENIVKTLRRGIESGYGGQSLGSSPRNKKTYRYNVINGEGQSIQSDIISSDFKNFQSNTPDELLFISSTFEGVTRDKERLGECGNGLTYLINFAVDICRGSVAFRIKNLVMNIKNANSETLLDSIEKLDYDVNITKFEDSMIEFGGNMITIKLPLKDSPIIK